MSSYLSNINLSACCKSTGLFQEVPPLPKVDYSAQASSAIQKATEIINAFYKNNEVKDISKLPTFHKVALHSSALMITLSVIGIFCYASTKRNFTSWHNHSSLSSIRAQKYHSSPTSRTKKLKAYSFCAIAPVLAIALLRFVDSPHLNSKQMCVARDLGIIASIAFPLINLIHSYR
ncbi:hypothetical protein AB751O23_AY_00080 [Chlamydiales bacterium SCGC AB-751-O23]|jgi:hypothetical protein|nr:hypothetical protein AB751O23_AY_00080 [Chlamydiales bacterium SCGC AB-751-O23]